ncbi:SDR family NAD(P)-dependent oxidoreductase [Pseudonocardia spinosispora]|uniref:SDR family NAD(P)-dependent oxidoreductase n=1 Tax=Pseudonocardia spinosispora TaxID=103441 RepID=UPI00040B496A|nr:SDR family NAD(P)-dependent oxidoreductase [Pseudonocardia spinosispora]
MNEARVVVVTGASRGAGRGIALALGAAGGTVYVTGRTEAGLTTTADEIGGRGGTGVPIVCDHADDEQVAAVFERVRREHGRLDVLVSNATALPASPPRPGQGFWERPLAEELKPLEVGLRSHYVAAHYAAPLLIAAGGLLVFTSAPGARVHLPGLHGPSYGAGKAGTDKLACDMGRELHPHGVTTLSIWMGVLRTERITPELERRLAGSVLPPFESSEFTGRVVDALANDPHRAEHNGRTVWGAELGARYGVTDTDGSHPNSHRAWLGPPSEFPEHTPTYAEFRAGESSPD